MSDDDKDWRAPDAKPMTFDQMTARAQYEWDRAEKAEAEALHCAQALTGARAEIEDVRRTSKHLLIAANIYQARAEKAESELSTLRARVLEVVGLGLDVISEERGWGTYPRMEGSEIYTDADVFSRAARQLMEEVK